MISEGSFQKDLLFIVTHMLVTPMYGFISNQVQSNGGENMRIPKYQTIVKFKIFKLINILRNIPKPRLATDLWTMIF